MHRVLFIIRNKISNHHGSRFCLNFTSLQLSNRFVCLFADVAIKVLDLRAGDSDIIGASEEGRRLFLHE